MTDKYWATSSCGRIELCMTLEQAESASHSGDCEEDVRALMAEPEIAAQIAKFDPVALRFDLMGYGAWESEELNDFDTNAMRFVWLAAGSISDDPESAKESA